jgi:hypothetical protein
MCKHLLHTPREHQFAFRIHAAQKHSDGKFEAFAVGWRLAKPIVFVRHYARFQ